MPGSTRRAAVVDLIFPALLITLQLSLLGPHTIYLGSAAEFNAPFWTLARHLLPAAAPIFATLLVPGAFLSGAWRKGYVALLFSVGIVLWVQSSFLVVNYGPLDGTAIEWSAQSRRHLYELAFWLVLPLLAVAGAKWIAPVAAFGSGVLMALQLPLLVNATLRGDPRRLGVMTRDLKWTP